MSAGCRDVADSPPADAVAPSSGYGCGAPTCVACYGNEAWRRWDAERQGFCWICGEDFDDPERGHDPDEECPWAGDAP